jgi:hypothetical protein
MDRPKVPIHHCAKIFFMVALQEEIYAYDPEMMRTVESALTNVGMTTKEIQAKRYYNVKFFRVRCDRVCLAPSRLYWQIRGVFVIYGPVIDPELKRPLFNKKAWVRANYLLKEVILGVYSDPPGMQLYHPKLTSKGEPKKDRLGLDLLECDRGTGNVENSHRINRDTFGTRQTGIESSDALSAERRHRHNHRASEIHRQGFPKVGHYDTWLVDQEQILMEQNHNVILYPTWSNPAIDYMDTAEKFQTVLLHSDALNNAINQLRIPLEVLNKFSVDQKYLCRVMGTLAPMLPIHGREAYKLFEKLMLERPGEPDNELSLEWVNHVDALEIYPTTVFYLQSHY